MTKSEFLKTLETELCVLPQADVQNTLDFYNEMIDDRIEEGVLEEDAVSQVGDAQEIAKQIIMETPISKLVKQKIKSKRSMTAVEIVLLILGSPIWLSLIVSGFAVLLSVYLSIWAIVISLWACEVSFIGGILGGIVSACIICATGQNVYAGAVMLAAGLFLVGFSILFFFVCKAATSCMVWISKKMLLWIKSLFLRKEQK